MQIQNLPVIYSKGDGMPKKTSTVDDQVSFTIMKKNSQTPVWQGYVQKGMRFLPAYYGCKYPNQKPKYLFQNGLTRSTYVKLGAGLNWSIQRNPVELGASLNLSTVYQLGFF